MAKPAVSPTRRGFLISVGTGGVAAAAAVVSAVAPETSSQAETNDQRNKRGYRVSEHINKYYRTTRV